MYTPARDLLLKWLRVPAEPHAPAGDPASLRVFRAGKNLFRLRLFTWGLAQAAALAAIVFWAAAFFWLEGAVQAQREARASAAPTAPAAVVVPRPPEPTASTVLPPSAPSSNDDTPANKSRDRTARKRRSGPGGWAGFKALVIDIGLRLPPWSFPLLWAVKLIGFLFYLVQIPITYAVRRLDFEMRWYIVTDRSLRIRTGVWRVQELTMSFANLQQVEVTQGPLQGLLGLADVRVQSAGGGGGAGPHGKGPGDSLHTAMFNSVDNATEIRDLILERLRRFRATGLGDPDDHPEHTAKMPAATSTASSAALAAAQELLAEARELRRAVAAGSAGGSPASAPRS